MPAILLTPPQAEPVSLAEAKKFLRVEHEAEDELIAALITSARAHVEAHTCRALITQHWRLSRDCWPVSGIMPLLPAPVVALPRPRRPCPRLRARRAATVAAGFLVDDAARTRARDRGGARRRGRPARTRDFAATDGEISR